MPNAPCEIVLINLDRATERLSFQQAQFKVIGLDFTRVPAVEGAEIDDAYYKRMSATGARLITRNEMGCLLSHAACWRHCVATGRPIVVLEDDAVLDLRFGDVVAAVQGRAIEENLFVNLEFGRQKLLGRKIEDVLAGVFSLDELVYSGGGAAGYLLTPDIARRLLNLSERRSYIADTHINRIAGIKYAQVNPAVVMQLGRMEAGQRNGISETVSKSTIEGRRTKPTSLQNFLANPSTKLVRLAGNFSRWYRNVRAIGRIRRGQMTMSPGVTETLARTGKMVANG